MKLSACLSLSRHGIFHFLWPLPCTGGDSRMRSTQSTLPPDRNRGGVSTLRLGLPLLIFIMAASALAGSGVVAVLAAGLSDRQPIVIAAAVGTAIAIPVTIVASRQIKG